MQAAAAAQDEQLRAATEGLAAAEARALRADGLQAAVARLQQVGSFACHSASPCPGPTCTS